MKYKSQILILFATVFCIYCFGKILPFAIRGPLFNQTSPDPTKASASFRQASRDHTKFYASQTKASASRIKSKGYKKRAQFDLSIIREILTATQSDSYVAILSSYTINPINRDNSYETKAFGKILQNGVPVNSGPLTIGNVTINAGTNNLYYYKYPLSAGKALLGTSVTAQINNGTTTVAAQTNNGTSTIQATQIMVVPKEIFPSTMSLPKTVVDRATNYSLNWQPDPNNQYGKVQIQISYNRGISQYYNASMPSSITDLVYRVADNGNYTIPQADLARFPRGSYVTISIARAWLDDVSSNIAYVTITEAHTFPILVVDPAACKGQYAVSGNASLCSSPANYTVPNLPAGSTIFWTISSNIATVNQAGTVTPTGTGTATLSANVTTSCGSFTLTKTISIGSPSINITSSQSGTCNGSYQPWSLNATSPNTVSSWQWTKDPSATGTWNIYSPNSPSTNVSVSGGGGGISVTATNSCGTSKNGVTIYSNCSATAIAASPNPTTDNVTITVVQSKDAASSKTAKGMIYQLKVTDQSGNIKKQYKYSGVSNTTISLSGLMNGTYTIQAFDGTTWSSVNVIKQ